MNQPSYPLPEARSGVKITAIKALQPKIGTTLIKVETDAGVCGYGPCGEKGPVARAVIDHLHTGRLPHLGLLGKDPLDIEVHHFNMFYAYPQRGRQMRVLSGIDIALWDLKGKLLGQPVYKLLGGGFRDEIRLYSHCRGGDFLDRGFWKETAANLKEDPHGFTAYKIDIHHVLKSNMQQFIPSISVQDVRNIHKAYTLAREEIGDEIDIIVHCHNELDLPSAVQVAAAIEHIKPLYFEDPINPDFTDSWRSLRSATRVPILTGENIELPEGALPFIQHQAVDALQPDIINCGGITAAKKIADMAAIYRMPVMLHNVSGYVFSMASQQFSAAVFNCPMLECVRTPEIAPEAALPFPEIKNGRLKISNRPGLGVELNQDWLMHNRADGEPWWD